MTFQDYLSETKTLAELCALWNEYAWEHAPEDQVYSSIAEYCETYSPNPEEAARMVFFGDVSNWFDRVFVNVYGNFVSFHTLGESPINLDTLADWMREAQAEDYFAWRGQEDASEE